MFPAASRLSGRRVEKTILRCLGCFALGLLTAGMLAGCAADSEPDPAHVAGVDGAEANAALPAGKWRPARTAPPGEWQRPENAEAVMAVPYLQGYRPARAEASVTVHEPTAAPGVNLYTSGHAAEAVLMDMDGRQLHRWVQPLRRFRPDVSDRETLEKLDYFRRARLLEGGDLLAIYEGLGLVRLDARSRPRWRYVGGAHHDLDLDPEGRIWLLDREGKLLPRIHPTEGVLEDFVTVLDADTGEVLRKMSILEAFERSEFAHLLERAPEHGDLLHTNTLEILDDRLRDRDPAFAAGRLLLSVLELDTVAVLDPETETIVWAQTGPWRKQHQPTVVSPGHLLVFDNTGPGVAAERSRVLELDPATGEVTWSFGGGEGADLWSKTLGSVQRLSGGNTLITESENGRAVEITPDGRTVWEFHNPHRAGDEGELVAVLFEVERLPAEAARFATADTVDTGDPGDRRGATP
jgi:hypothetical protein